MRALFAGVVFLSMGTGACALIAGLSDYGGGSGGAADSSVTRLVRDTGLPGDEGGADPPPVEAAPHDDSTAPDDASLEAAVDNENESGLGPDAKPPCTAQTCGTGCCSASGDCVGGKQSTTCGSAGGQCEDCTTSGQVCSAAGACEAPKPDAGPATCTAKSCGSCGSLQTACCTSSHVCGCMYFWPSACQ